MTSRIIGAAIKIHRELGPGLLESSYEECLCHELSRGGIAFERQVSIPIRYDSLSLQCGYRADLVVESAVIVEIKSIANVLPVHEAQLLTYMKHARIGVGLLFNFYVPVLTQGMVRRVL